MTDMISQLTNGGTPPAILGAAPVTMSSREIAELVEKRHDNVKRTIDTLSERGVISFPQIEEIPTATKPATVYRLEKRDTLVVVAQLSPEFTARVVDRWQELEASVAATPLTGPQLMAAALIEAEATLKAKDVQIEALTPKAEALDRLEAAEGAVSVRVAAKMLNVQERKFVKWLQSSGWAFRQGGVGPLQAYVDKRNIGYLEHRAHTYFDEGRSEDRVKIQMLVTPKGLARLASIFAKSGAPA